MAQFSGAINIDCPSCGEQLPTVSIKSTVGRFALGLPSGWFVKLEADLTDEWWAEVNRDHIACVLL